MWHEVTALSQKCHTSAIQSVTNIDSVASSDKAKQKVRENITPDDENVTLVL
jgi:hypothetical protein